MKNLLVGIIGSGSIQVMRFAVGFVNIGKNLIINKTEVFIRMKTHRCDNLKKEQRELRRFFDIGIFLKIEFYPSQDVWCLNVKNHQSIVINSCPFCGLGLTGLNKIVLL